MSVSVAEVRAFIKDAEEFRQNFITVFDASWDELKKRGKDGKVFSLKSKRKRYPIWNSVFRIRQPLILARAGIPVCKDTTLDGSDPDGATAALIKERLAINLEKADEGAFDTYCACRDDFLAGNFALPRAFYEREVRQERVRQYLTPQQLPDGSARFVDSNGEEVRESEVWQDEQGTFIYTKEIVDVVDEKVFVEHMSAKDVYIDPDIKRWARCKRLAFRLYYSEPEFIEAFGKQAFQDLPQQNPGKDEASPKRQLIEVIEYWDAYDKKVYWLAENGQKFLKPSNYLVPDEAEEEEVTNGLYDLDWFFPTPKRPLLINAPSDEFYPIPEYYQIIDQIENIHSLFRRMFQTASALRARLMFDSGVEGLEVALKELSDVEAVGITGLGSMLAGAGGSLSNFAQYIDIQPIVNALDQIYNAFERALADLYKLTGTNDLLQGLVTDQQQRTLGERQMSEKYALSLIEPMQRRMQELIRDLHELRVEIALNTFKEETIDQYVNPATLPQEHQERYRRAMSLLKDNRKRFRIELETDSTIAINEEFNKQMAAETARIITEGLTAAANAATGDNPELVIPILHVLKFYVQQTRQSKLFTDEHTKAIDRIVERIQQKQQNAQPEFNKDKADIELRNQELQVKMQIEGAQLQLQREKLFSDSQLRQMEIQARTQLETYKTQQDQVIANIEAQIASFRAHGEVQERQASTVAMLEKVRADMAMAQQELALKREELFVKFQEIAGKQQVEEFRAALEEQATSFDAQIKLQQQALDERLGMLDEQEKYWTEARLQQEHELEKVRTRVETLATIKEMTKPPEMPPVTVNVEAPKPKKSKRKFKIQRDSMGELTSVEEVSEDDNQGKKK